MKTRYIYYGIIAAGVVLAIVGFAVGNALRVWGILFAVVAAIALIVHVQNEKKVAERLAEEKEALRLQQLEEAGLLEEERARLEAERLAAKEAAERAAEEAAEAAARKDAELLALEEAEKAKKPVECEGPTARFRAGCR